MAAQAADLEGSERVNISDIPMTAKFVDSEYTLPHICVFISRVYSNIFWVRTIPDGEWSFGATLPAGESV